MVITTCTAVLPTGQIFRFAKRALGVVADAVAINRSGKEKSDGKRIVALV